MRRFLPLLITLFLTPPLFAWSPSSDQRIAKKAAQLAPPDLKLLLDKFSAEYMRGVQLAARDEGSATHHYFMTSKQGALRKTLEDEVRAAVQMIRKREPMSLFIERLGRIAHLVADANNPFHVESTDPRLEASHADFEGYLERKLTTFPTVFYGLERNLNLPSYLDGMLRRSAHFYPLLSEEYFRFGERRTSAEFDDRSTAFGVASISYSRSVSDLVNLYFYIWKEAGGDVRSARVLQKGNLLLNGN
ncbi:MAG TPA: hypothetical protein VM939_02965 [Gemmatimonadaceae bacterium]|nr:hypothetical protein [Gemmatimonadaceae bacterium]